MVNHALPLLAFIDILSEVYGAWNRPVKLWASQRELWASIIIYTYSALSRLLWDVVVYARSE